MEEKNTNFDKQIKQSRELPKFRYKLGLSEHKILLCFFGQLRQNNRTFEPEQIPLDDITRYCGFTEANPYRIVRESARTLSKEALEYYNGKDYSYVPWFRYIRYKNGTIYYQLNDAIKSELLQLYENNRLYISMDPKILPKFRNNYALRLYLILKGDLVAHKTTTAYSLEEICYMLALSTTYSPKNNNKNAVANQKSKIIEPAVEEINAVSDLHTEYEPVKENKKTVGWRFKITGWTETKPEKTETTQQIASRPWYDDADVENAVKEIIARGVDKPAVPSIIKKFDSKEDFLIAKASIMSKLAEKIAESKTPDNMGGWIYSAFERYDPTIGHLFDKIENNIIFENTYNLPPALIDQVRNAKRWKDIISLAKEQEKEIAINLIQYAKENQSDLLTDYKNSCTKYAKNYDLELQLAHTRLYGTSYLEDPLSEVFLDEVPF